MIRFNRHKLDNGLRLLHYQDSVTKMVTLNLLYNVGSKDESPQHTGLAHLMEHLMFTGSKNVPKFDAALQRAGGSSNAWTSVDMTNYFETLPAHNIETAMWVESDRLMALNLSDESIRIQKDVVMEEFKQRLLNEPYGDLTHLMHSLTYKVHPYQWPTIGKTLDEIDEMPREVILDFYNKYYSVDNLVMCIAGNIDFEKAVDLTEKWFGDFKPSGIAPRNLPAEPPQTEPRILRVERDVPQSMLLKLYHMPAYAGELYPACDLLSDVLSSGNSARFQQNVLTKSSILTDLEACIEATLDPGLFIVRAQLNDGTTFEQAEEIVNAELNNILKEGVTQYELEKCLNKFHAAAVFDNQSYQEKATRLCKFELVGNADLINEEIDRYRAVTIDVIDEAARNLFDTNNCSTIYYSKKQ